MVLSRYEMYSHKELLVYLL